MVGHRSDGPAYTASIRAYSCRGTTVPLAWELSQGQVVPYLSLMCRSPFPDATGTCILGQNSCRRPLRAQSGYGRAANQRPLLRVKRTSRELAIQLGRGGHSISSNYD